MTSSLSPVDYPYLPRRIAVAREKSGRSQADLSKHIGFKDRQTLAAVESGRRRVSADELVAIAEATGQKIDFFTDPFLMAGEGKFSYRASGTAVAELDVFEEKARRWLALWRRLGELRGESPRLLRPRLAINMQSTSQEAQAAGEAVGRELGLGGVPAEKLAGAVEEKFQLLVLQVDMPAGVSGAAVQLASGDAILVNRTEPSEWKSFDLAHELFHVLTWDALPPERVDLLNPTGYKQKHTEEMAETFAAALLMPESELKPCWIKLNAKLPLNEALHVLAEHFHVPTEALGWRLVALGYLNAADLPENSGRASCNGKETVGRRFSPCFLERSVWGIDRGEVSVRRLLGLLDLSLEEFRECCKAYGLKAEIGL